MSRVEVTIRFFYEDVLYADTQGYIPRYEAINIPGFKIEEREAKEAQLPKQPQDAGAQGKGRNKKDSDIEEEANDDNDDN